MTSISRKERVDLLPCPLCNERPVGPTFVGDEDGGYFYVECPNNGREDGHFCGVHTDSEEQAIAAWNTRISPDVSQSEGMVEALTEIERLTGEARGWRLLRIQLIARRALSNTPEKGD